MFFGLSKDLGRIPKKNQTKSSNPNSTSQKERASDENKSSKCNSVISDKDFTDKSMENDIDLKHKDCSAKDKNKTDKDSTSKDKEIRSSLDKGKYKDRHDDDLVLDMTYEREDDMAILDSVGNGFNRQEMVREVVSGNDELDKIFNTKKEIKGGEVVIPGLGDLDELDTIIKRKRKKPIKRTVLVTDSDLKISLPAHMEMRAKNEPQLDLPKLVNFALFGDEVLRPMSAACMHQYECCLALHPFMSSPWTKSVSKKYVESKKKFSYTVEIFNTEHCQSDGKPYKNITIIHANNKLDNKRNCFDDFTNKSMSVVEKNKGKVLKSSDSSHGLHKRNAENLLVIPAPTRICELSDDDDDGNDDDFHFKDVHRGPNIGSHKDVTKCPENRSLKDLNKSLEVETLKDVCRESEVRTIRDVNKGPQAEIAKDVDRSSQVETLKDVKRCLDTEKLIDVNIDVDKEKDKNMIKEKKESNNDQANKNKQDEDKDITQNVRRETKCKNDKGFNVNDDVDASIGTVNDKGNAVKESHKGDNKETVDNTCVITVEMSAPTSRSPTSSNQIRKRRPSCTENMRSKEESAITNNESQDNKRRSNEKSRDLKSEERRSLSKNRSSRSRSRDRSKQSKSIERQMRSTSRDRLRRSQSKERNNRSQSRERITEVPSEKNIASRLLKIASSSVVSEPDKMSSKSEKRRERQFHPYKKETRPSKRHIPHWSFDLAYSDMNELLQNLTKKTFKETNCRPANVGSRNKVGRRSYDDRGRFSRFRFRRSAIPKTPPREVYYSSEDEEYMVQPEDIPDLKERAKQADVLETFMGTGEDEKEFSTEMLIYEKEATEDKRIVNKKSDLIIPGGPRTATFSGQELEDSNDTTDELAFHGSVRNVENLDEESSQPSKAVIKRKSTYTNNLVKSKLLEMKSGVTNENSKKEDAIELHKTEQDENKCDANEDTKADEDARTSNQNEKEIEAKDAVYKNEEEEKIDTPLELKSDSPQEASPERKVGSEDTKESNMDRGNARKNILLSDSDVCLDWTDEENALDIKGEEDVFIDSSDGMSETTSPSFIVIDTVGGSDSETPEKIGTNKPDNLTGQPNSEEMDTNKLDNPTGQPNSEEMDTNDLDNPTVQTNYEEMDTNKLDNPTGLSNPEVKDTNDLDNPTVQTNYEEMDTNKLDNPTGYTNSEEEEKKHNLSREFSEIGKNVQESLEHMVDSVCVDISESDYTVVDECTITPDNSFENENTITDKHNISSNITDDDTVTKPDLTKWQIKQCSAILTRMKMNEGLKKMDDNESAVFDEEETFIDDQASNKEDLSITPSVVQNDAPHSPSVDNKSGDVVDMETTNEVLDSCSNVTSHPEPSNIHEEIKPDEEDQFNTSICIKRILDTCISEVEAMMEPRDDKFEKHQTDHVDENEDNSRHSNTVAEPSDKIQNPTLCQNKLTGHSIESIASPKTSPEFQQTVFSDDSEPCVETDIAFNGKDMFLFIDDVLVIGQKESDIDKTQNEVFALDYKKKDEILMQNEMLMNSLDLNSSDSESVPELEEIVEEYVDTEGSITEHGDGRSGDITGEFNIKRSDPNKDSVKHVREEMDDMLDRLCSKASTDSVITPGGESDHFSQDTLPKSIDNDKVDHELDEHKTESTETCVETDTNTDISVALDLSISRYFDSIVDNTSTQTSHLDVPTETENMSIVEENKVDDNDCICTEDTESDAGYKHSSSEKSLSIDVTSGSDDIVGDHQTTPTQVRGIDYDMESTSSTWAYPLSEPDNELSQRSSVYPSQIDDDAVFHIKDTFDEETSVSDDINKSQKIETDIATEETSNESIDVENNHSQITESVTSGQNLSNRNNSVSAYNQNLYNSNVRTPTTLHPHPWLPFNRHPYNMWPPYSMWQPFQGPQSPTFSPYSGPSLLPYSHPGQQSPLSPYIWRPVPLYAPGSNYVNSAVYSPSFMNYMLNSNQQSASEQANPSAASLVPWILYTDNMTPYIQNQNPDTYHVTECISNKSSKISSRLDIPVSKVSSRHDIPVSKVSSRHDIPVSKVSSRLDIPVSKVSSRHDIPVSKVSSRHDIPVSKVSSRLDIPVSKVSSVLDIPVSEIPLPKGNPPIRKANPRKLQDLCKNRVGSSHKNDVNPGNKTLPTSLSVEQSDSKTSQLHTDISKYNIMQISDKCTEVNKISKDSVEHMSDDIVLKPQEKIACNSDTAYTSLQNLPPQASEKANLSKENDLTCSSSDKTDGNFEGGLIGTSEGNDLEEMIKCDTNEKDVTRSESNIISNLHMTNTDNISLTNECKSVVYHSGCRLKNLTNAKINAKHCDKTEKLHHLKNVNNTDTTRAKTSMEPSGKLKDTGVGVTSSRKSGIKLQARNGVGYLLNNLRHVNNKSGVEGKHPSKSKSANEPSALLAYNLSDKKKIAEFPEKACGAVQHLKDNISENYCDLKGNIHTHKKHETDVSLFDTNHSAEDSGSSHNSYKFENTDNSVHKHMTTISESGIRSSSKENNFSEVSLVLENLVSKISLKYTENTNDENGERLEDEASELQQPGNMKNHDSSTIDTISNKPRMPCYVDVIDDDASDIRYRHKSHDLKTVNSLLKNFKKVKPIDSRSFATGSQVPKEVRAYKESVSAVHCESDQNDINEFPKMTCETVNQENKNNINSENHCYFERNVSTAICNGFDLDRSVENQGSNQTSENMAIFGTDKCLFSKEDICSEAESVLDILVSRKTVKNTENKIDTDVVSPEDEVEISHDIDNMKNIGNVTTYTSCTKAEDELEVLHDDVMYANDISSMSNITRSQVLNSVGYLLNNLKNLKTDEMCSEPLETHTSRKISADEEVALRVHCEDDKKTTNESQDEASTSVSQQNGTVCDLEGNFSSGKCLDPDLPLSDTNHVGIQGSSKDSSKSVETNDSACKQISVISEADKSLKKEKNAAEICSRTDNKSKKVFSSLGYLLKNLKNKKSDEVCSEFVDNKKCSNSRGVNLAPKECLESELACFYNSIGDDLEPVSSTLKTVNTNTLTEVVEPCSKTEEEERTKIDVDGDLCTEIETHQKQLKEFQLHETDTDMEQSSKKVYSCENVRKTIKSVDDDNGNESKTALFHKTIFVDEVGTSSVQNLKQVEEESTKTCAGETKSTVPALYEGSDKKLSSSRDKPSQEPDEIVDVTEDTIGNVDIQENSNNTYLKAAGGNKTSDIIPEFINSTEGTDKINNHAYTSLWVGQTVHQSKMSQIAAMNDQITVVNEENIDSSEMCSGKTQVQNISSSPSRNSAYSGSSVDSGTSSRERSRSRSHCKNIHVSPSSVDSYSESSSSTSDSRSTSQDRYRSNVENTCIDVPKNTKTSVILMDYDNDLATKEWCKRKLMHVADEKQSRVKRRDKTSGNGIYPTVNKMTDSLVSATECDDKQCIEQGTEDELQLVKQSGRNKQLCKPVDKDDGRKLKKFVCLKPDVLKILLKAGMEDFLEILNENSTDQWDWCLDLLREDILMLDHDQQDTVRKLEKRYSNLTIISGINNLDSYLMRKVRSQDVLQIFVLADDPDEDENVRSLIKYTCMETFLEEHIYFM